MKKNMYGDHGDWQKLRALFHAAKAALRAASQRTGVPVDEKTLGRQRRSAGRFFDDRDHTTVGLHSCCAAWRIGPPKIRSFTRT